MSLLGTQLPLDLQHRVSFGATDYFVSPTNRDAFEQVVNWRKWPEGKLMITGDAQSGKTHLAHIFAHNADAVFLRSAANIETWLDEKRPHVHVVIDGVEGLISRGLTETSLFHVHNRIKSEGGTLLLTTRQTPDRWGVVLPDLVSRMTATHMVAIAEPDDVLIAAIIVKTFGDRGVFVPPDVVDYILRRTAREYVAILSHVDAIDQLSRAESRRVTDRLAARYFREL